MEHQEEGPMPPRAADDFVTIGAKYKELTAVPVPKRSGTGMAGMHCDQCPHKPDEYCGKTCSEEAVKAGVVE
jgi:hypothetical protein